MSLGQRCVDWCHREMAREDPPSAETLASWFSHAMRRNTETDEERPLGITAGNHCAIAQSAAARECAQGEAVPHGQRAAARELMWDAINAHVWHEATEARSKLWVPQPGDLAIYDRSIPGRPETSWYGHVDRVVSVDSAAGTYQNIGANEGPGGRWRVQSTSFGSPRLLGFVAYPQPAPEPPKHLLSDAEIERIKQLVQLTAFNARFASETQWWVEVEPELADAVIGGKA